jgi:hypothetical protein
LQVRLALLPGMDGTGELFANLVAAFPIRGYESREPEGIDPLRRIGCKSGMGLEESCLTVTCASFGQDDVAKICNPVFARRAERIGNIAGGGAICDLIGSA